MIISKELIDKLETAETIRFLIEEAKMFFFPLAKKIFQPNEIDFVEVKEHEKESIILAAHFRNVDKKKIREFLSLSSITHLTTFNRKTLEIVFMKKVYNESGSKKKLK